MKRTIIVGVLFSFLMSLAIYRMAAVYFNCHRVIQGSQAGNFYYWMWDYRTVTHGICANMYGNDDVTSQTNVGPWVVELPKYGEPTALYQFESRGKAEAFAESRCPSRNKEWKAVK